jgi:hypothetical protein
MLKNEDALLDSKKNENIDTYIIIIGLIIIIKGLY